MRRIVFWAVILALLIVPVDVVGQGCQPGQCPSQRPQPWYAQPIGRPIQQMVPARPANPLVISQPRKGHEAVVRITVDEANGVRGYGSGVIVDTKNKSALVLTAGHLFSDPYRAITVYVKGRGYKARLVHRDSVQDLAALEITDPGVGQVVIRETDLSVDSETSGCGFGAGGYRTAKGRLIEMVSPDEGKTWEWGKYAMAVRNGDSGGPILDRTGRLVGVISGYRPQDRATYGPCLPRVRAFLRCVLPPYPNRPGVIIPKPVVVMPVQPVLPEPWRPSPTPTPTLPTPEPSPVMPVIDYNKLAAFIYAKVQADADEFRGPAGPEGPRGEQGLQGDEGLKGKTGGAGPTPAINISTIISQLTPERIAAFKDLLTDEQMAAFKNLLGLDEPLFYVVHKDPETGELIPQRDPETGEMLGIQPIRMGNHYTIYLYHRSDMQKVTP